MNWVLTKDIPTDPGFYWVLVNNEYGLYVYHYIVRVKDDGTACWVRNSVGYAKIEHPPVPDLETVQNAIQ